MKKRNIRMPVYFSQEEYNNLNDMSSKTGLSRNEIVRLSLVRTKFLVPPPIDYNYFIGELRRFGNNLNQLLLIARTSGFINSFEIENGLFELRNLEKEIRDKFNFKYEEKCYGNS